MKGIYFTKYKKTRQKVIRFRRRGALHYPIFEIVLTFKDRRNRSSFIEKLGFYNPNPNLKILHINGYRLGYWLMKGVLLNYNVKKRLVKFLF
jgi:ribosomal protein S16